MSFVPQERLPLIPADVKPMPTPGQSYVSCLDAVRVVMAIGIVLTHGEFYFDTIRHFRDRIVDYPIVGGTPLMFLISGRYCVFVFCLVAGYVNSLKALRFRNYRLLIHSSHKRFLRLWPLMLFVQVMASVMIYYFNIAAPRGAPFTDCRDDFTLDCLTSRSAVGVIPGILRAGAWGATGSNGLYYSGPLWVFFWFALCPPFCLVLYAMCVNKGAGQQLCGMLLCFIFTMSPYTCPLLCMTGGFCVAMAQTGHLDDLRDWLCEYFPVRHTKDFATYFWLGACVVSHVFLYKNQYHRCSAINSGGAAWCNIPLYVCALSAFAFLMVTPIVQWAVMFTRIGALGKYAYACYVIHVPVFHVMHVLGGWTLFEPASYEPDISYAVKLTGDRTILGAPHFTQTTYSMLTIAVIAFCCFAMHHLIEEPLNAVADRFAEWMVPLEEKEGESSKIAGYIPPSVAKRFGSNAV